LPALSTGKLSFSRKIRSILACPDHLFSRLFLNSVHAITKSLTPAALNLHPAERTGLEVLESSLFRLTSFQTVSGIKFLLFTEPQQPNVDLIMRKVYELYADYVTKNPFYQMEMPIRCEAFDRHLLSYIRAK
jgi:trafficking protein particle complex subunit 4